MRIQHNIAALNSHRQLGSNNSAVGKNLEKLSSGFRINRAGDDAAGLAISEKMRAQITGLNTASKNSQDGISLVQTAEGALTEVHSMLNRMSELAGQAANGTYKDEVDRENVQSELDSLRSEIDRISDGTNFNGIKLLDGSLSNAQGITLNFGATEIKATAGAAFGTGTVQIASAKGNDEGIKVTVDVAGASVKVELGSKAAASYTAENINNAVREAANKLLTEGTATDVAKVTALTSFSVSFTGSLNFAANAEVDSGTKAMAALNANAKGLTLQIGDTSDPYNKLTVEVDSMSTASLGINAAKLNVNTQEAAAESVKLIKDAINTVSSTRGDLGAIQNRLEHTINNLGVTAENMTAAESRIRDVDMAQEMMNFTKNNILTQASQAMLAQANQLPQGVLQLLQ